MKPLKDLKLFVTIKSIKGNRPIPITVAKLHERIILVRNKVYSALLTYLKYKECTRDDILSLLIGLSIV